MKAAVTYRRDEPNDEFRWAARVAPTLTTNQWKALAQRGVTPAFTEQQCVLLCAYRDREVLRLSAPARTPARESLFRACEGRHQWPTGMHSAVLARTGHVVAVSSGAGIVYKATSFGREIVRLLREPVAPRRRDQAASDDLVRACRKLNNASWTGSLVRSPEVQGEIVEAMARLLEEFGLDLEAQIVARTRPQFEDAA